MAALTSVSFSPAIGHSSAEGRSSSSSSLGRSLAFSTCEAFRFRTLASARVRSSSSSSSSGIVIRCMSTTADLPTVAETKLNFLKAYKKPIPSIYNNVLQELIVQQHLIRNDANKLEEWARAQTATSLVEFPSREGEVEGLLKAIAERAAAGKFSYSRFFAVGLFRLLELSNATEPTVLEKLCAALNVDKRSVDRDLDVYRNLLSKLVQAKELLKEYVAREKKKREERTTESQKASEAVKNCVAQPNYIG
ncbi:Protein THYLAKOID FORMATION1, chloroplastic [Linum perenne]